MLLSSLFVVLKVIALILSLIPISLSIVFLCQRGKNSAKEWQLIHLFNHSVNMVDLPTILSQIPVYNDKEVIADTIDAVVNMRYPVDKHVIQVLDDSNNEATGIIAQKVAFYARQGFRIYHIRRANREGYKAGALNNGMTLCQASYIALFDSDCRPHPDFLYNMLPLILNDKKLAFVQARRFYSNHNHSLIARLMTLHMLMKFSLQVSQSLINVPPFFEGHAGLWRYEVIAELGGWSCTQLLEDIDLSMKAFLAGYTSTYSLMNVCQSELPVTTSAAKIQLYRWCRGGALVIKAHRKNVIHSKILTIPHKINFFIWQFTLFYITLPILFLLAPLSSLASPSTLNSQTAVYVFLVMIFLPWGVFFKMEGRGMKQFVFSIPLYFMFVSGFMITFARAVMDGFFNRKQAEFVTTPKMSLPVPYFSKNTRFFLNVANLFEIIFLTSLTAIMLVFINANMTASTLFSMLLVSGQAIFLGHYYTGR